MAAIDSESYLTSDSFSQRHRNGSPFGIPNFFMGFSPQNSSDNDSARSPTSPLDIVFSSLKNPFGFRSQKPSAAHAGSRKILDCSKVGLAIVNLLAEETQVIGEVNADAPQRKSIIFRPQVKNTDILDCYEGLLVTPEPFKDIVSSWSDSRPASFSHNLNLGLKNFTSENNSVIMSLPKLFGRDSEFHNSVVSKPNSLPISIGSGHSYADMVSATDIELSEDYTCVICHGPNPKTTHIFGDCILECHANELSNFAKEEEEKIVVLPQVARRPEEPTIFPSDELLSFCYSCKNKLKEGEDIYIYRGEKAFCSLECRSEVISAEEETEKNSNNSGSHEELFLVNGHEESQCDEWS